MKAKEGNECSETSTEALGPIENNEETQGSSNAKTLSNGFRVREVSEINDDKEIYTAQPSMKRRQCQNDAEVSINGKKSKCSEDTLEGPESFEVNGSEETGSDLQEVNGNNEEISSSDAEFSEKDMTSAEKNKDLHKSPATSLPIEMGMQDAQEPNIVDDPSSSSTGILVKIEETDTENCASQIVDIKPSLNVKKEEATSTSRESCKFGIRCYRRNPMHRKEEAHPGDHDYKRPKYPVPPLGTPDCPYGDACYRRNPAHFQQFSHPPETDFEENWKNFHLRLRQRRHHNQNNVISSKIDNSDLSLDLDDYEEEDPFNDDDDLDEDYAPSDNEDDDEDYDECEKAEE